MNLSKINREAQAEPRGPKFEQGRRYGVKACVTFLHAQAEQMNDPRARAILNVVAHEMGLHFKASDPNASGGGSDRRTTWDEDLHGIGRCGACKCATFARIDALQPNGRFTPGDYIRCVNCKREAFWPTPVTVLLQAREDGGLRVWSDDERGLILSGANASAVSADIWPAIQALRAHRASGPLPVPPRDQPAASDKSREGQ